MPFPERPLPPEHPDAAEFPQPLRELIGWTAERLHREVGEPDSRFTGNRWFVKEEGLGQTYVRQRDGRITVQESFGPRAPQGIALGQDYTVWRYNNIGAGRTCLVYLVESNGLQLVVDVDAYPCNAVF